MTQASLSEQASSQVPAAPSLDRRSVRTRASLRDALAAAIESTGDLSRVTVTAVADGAGVTRRTFYSHFKDIPDLVAWVEGSSIDELRPYVRSVVASHLDELERVISKSEPAPGAVELLTFFKNRPYVCALIGEGGDPAFAERIKAMVHEEVCGRALDGIDARTLGPFFDYYLTFVVSAEAGVLVRWIAGGMEEDVCTMAEIMTLLAFVRPGDLYNNPMHIPVTRLGIALIKHMKENSHA